MFLVSIMDNFDSILYIGLFFTFFGFVVKLILWSVATILHVHMGHSQKYFLQSSILSYLFHLKNFFHYWFICFYGINNFISDSMF